MPDNSNRYCVILSQ